MCFFFIPWSTIDWRDYHFLFPFFTLWYYVYSFSFSFQIYSTKIIICRLFFTGTFFTPSLASSVSLLHRLPSLLPSLLLPSLSSSSSTYPFFFPLPFPRQFSMINICSPQSALWLCCLSQILSSSTGSPRTLRVASPVTNRLAPYGAFSVSFGLVSCVPVCVASYTARSVQRTVSWLTYRYARRSPWRHASVWVAICQKEEIVLGFDRKNRERF